MRPQAMLTVDQLGVHSPAKALLQGVSFCLTPGDALVLLGESGAGKSLLAQAIMGNLPEPLKAQGQIQLGAKGSRADQPATRRHWWGKHLALLPQEPALALDPLRRIDTQLEETLRLVAGQSPAQARDQATKGLQQAGLGQALRHRPWQLSGAMAQRAGTAMALAGGAQVLLADEPTKGLDATWVQHTLAAFEAVRAQGGCVVVITHDLRVARALGGQLMVMQGGQVVEQGHTHAVLAAPQHAFTQRLLAADPSSWRPRPSQPMRESDWVLRGQGLSVQHGSQRLFEGLSIGLHRGQRTVLQGPSGSGKSTLGRVLLGLQRPDAGQVLRAPGLAPTACQKLYQDPANTFAPQVSLRLSLQDAARHHRCAWPQVQAWLHALKLDEALLARLPSQVSGGELQRIAMARVLCARPAMLFADEPTSRLDTLTQQETLQALLKAIDALDAALLLVTHDDDLAQAVGDVRLLWARPEMGA